MEHKKSPWRIFTVRYWNHRQQPKKLNDCFGNSVSWVGKARTKEEALRKAKAHNSVHNLQFRLESINDEHKTV